MGRRSSSVRSFPAPESMARGITGTCKWCGEATVEKPAIYWHPACADQYNLHTNPTRQREFVVDRDGERCAICGDAPTRWLRGEPASVLDWSRGQSQEPWLRELWTHDDFRDLRTFDPATGQPIGPPDAWMLRGGQCSIDRVSALELDHRVPLWSVVDLPDEERRWYFGPGNLWLLCPLHHKEKTKREAGERAREKAARRAQLPLL